MMFQRLNPRSPTLVVAGLMAFATLLSRADEPQRAATAPGPSGRQPAQAAALKPVTDPRDSGDTFAVSGRVVDPDGKPVASAGIYVHHYTEKGRFVDEPIPEGQQAPVAVTGPDGRFRVELNKAASDSPFQDEPPWHMAQIGAVAPGFGPAWILAGSIAAGAEPTLSLVRDNVPIRGRLLDTQGRPIPGATVRALRIGKAEKGADLGAILARGRADEEAVAVTWYQNPTWLGRNGAWQTDGDGRFEIRGVGQDQIVSLGIRSQAHEQPRLYVMARQSPTPTKPESPTTSRGEKPFWDLSQIAPIVGATFETRIARTKPINGVVRQQDSGQPLAGVDISGFERENQTQVWAKSDARGRFHLIGLPKAATYEVRAAPSPGIDPFLDTTITVTDTPGLVPIETALELSRGVIVTGRLIDKATGRSLRSQVIVYDGLPTNRHSRQGYSGRNIGTTDATFRITAPPGEGLIFATLLSQAAPYTYARLRAADRKMWPGLEKWLSMVLSQSHAYRIVDIPAGIASINMDLELDRGRSRRGRLVDPDGRPVVGVLASGLIASHSVANLADDTFLVHGLDPGYPRMVLFSHEARQLVGSAAINVNDQQDDKPLEVRLGPGGSIQGRLVGDDGRPWAGMTLSLTMFDGEGHLLPRGRHGVWPENQTFTTSADGRFRIDGLKPGVKTIISVKTPLNLWLDTGGVLHELIMKQGEIRDVGDVKAKPSPR